MQMCVHGVNTYYREEISASRMEGWAMRRSVLAFAISLVASSVAQAENLCTTFQTLPLSELPGSCDPEWSKDRLACPECFRPNFGYPRTLPAPERLPWEGTNFEIEPEKFLQEVLAYALEGFEGENLSRWDVYRNPVRRWYHAPWMHPHDHDGSGMVFDKVPVGYNPGTYGPVRTGREYLLGLTEELQSLPHFLGANQPEERTNWAVSFYNPRAAHTLWQVWEDGTKGPNIMGHAEFAPGSVFAKPLYTTATAEEVPFLSGAPTVEANVSQIKFEVWDRKPSTLRLIQFDVAVKFDRETFEAYTGLTNTLTWVYGTFVYDGRDADLSNDDPWARLRPVGLTWGNDPDLEDCSGKTPGESILLMKEGVEDLGIDIHPARAIAKPCNQQAFGREGRLNGPVDNPISSCISCHGAAQYRRGTQPIGTEQQEKINVRNPWPEQWSNQLTNEEFWKRDMCLFLNRSNNFPLGDEAGGNCFKNAEQYLATDSSLQLAFGLTRYCMFVTQQHRKPMHDVDAAFMARTHGCAEALGPLFDRYDDLEGSDRSAAMEDYREGIDQVFEQFPTQLPGKGAPPL